MKKKRWNRALAVLLMMVMSISLLSACGGKSEKKEDAETITVYLWSTNLYEKYAPYIQEQLPDINVEFVVGNNDLDFYRFLKENGGLPDIITCCRFSLHDASPLKDSLMDLSTTNEAGAVYDTYLSNFMNEDGSVNWLPVCADAHGFIVNKDLFEKYDIPLPTDYESFVSACEAFDKVGIRGFTADYHYDYTCMETLQGLSASELSSVDGRKWRTTYSDPESTKREGLDDTVWPEAFERMEQFIQDTGLSQDDLNLSYDDIVEMYQSGKLSMYFGSSSRFFLIQFQCCCALFFHMRIHKRSLLQKWERHSPIFTDIFVIPEFFSPIFSESRYDCQFFRSFLNIFPVLFRCCFRKSDFKRSVRIPDFQLFFRFPSFLFSFFGGQKVIHLFSSAVLLPQHSL